MGLSFQQKEILKKLKDCIAKPKDLIIVYSYCNGYTGLNKMIEEGYIEKKGKFCSLTDKGKIKLHEIETLANKSKKEKLTFNKLELDLREVLKVKDHAKK